MHYSGYRGGGRSRLAVSVREIQTYCLQWCQGEKQQAPPFWAGGRNQTPPESLRLLQGVRSKAGTSASLPFFASQRLAPLGFSLPITWELKARPPAWPVLAQQRLRLQFINYYWYNNWTQSFLLLLYPLGWLSPAPTHSHPSGRCCLLCWSHSPGILSWQSPY